MPAERQSLWATCFFCDRPDRQTDRWAKRKQSQVMKKNNTCLDAMLCQTYRRIIVCRTVHCNIFSKMNNIHIIIDISLYRVSQKERKSRCLQHKQITTVLTVVFELLLTVFQLLGARKNFHNTSFYLFQFTNILWL